MARSRSPARPKVLNFALSSPVTTERYKKRSMSKNIRSVSIVVADDHPVVLGGLITLLKQDKTFRLAASCANGLEAIDAIRTLRPDLALLDVNMPGLNGLQVLKTLIAENLPTRVCFLAASLTDKEIVAAATGGAFGIILKESAPDTLVTCLHAIAAGQKWLPADLVRWGGRAATGASRGNRQGLGRTQSSGNRNHAQGR